MAGHRHHRHAAATLARITAAALIAGSALFAAARAEEPIRIGSSIPITGTAAFFGQHSRWGAQLAVDETNAAGGVLGRQIELDFQDNRCNPTEAVKSVSQMLSEKKDVAILDGLCSSAILAIMPLVERGEVPLIVANGTATAIVDKSGAGGNKWTFKVNPSDGSLADALVAYLVEHEKQKAAKIAVLGEDTDFGRGGAQALDAALGKFGMKIASSDFYQQGTPDFTAVFTKLRSEKPAMIAVYAVGADVQNIARQYVSFGVGIPLTGRLLTELVPPEILKSGALDGSVIAQPYVPEVDTPEAHAFLDAFKKKFDSLPNLLSRNSYEATRVLLDAIKRARKSEPAAIRDALQKTDMKSLLGGELKFDDHNLAHDFAVIVTIKDGKLAVAGLNKT
ncbi:MAG TPA: ABC transporter substrate-binding protein [Stellaceae bacterium]|jgi:branched-chain amino acid transport system substrate-binding protein|nr:ABC transporter substrate-binding protein [Stellaceae bacterium]